MENLVLCVDDDPEVLQRLTFILHRAGFTTLVAKNGYDALALAVSRKPALILLDLILPDIPGEEICRRLRSHTPTASIPIIMLTVRSDELAKVRGLEIGADDYVTKPFSEQILIARVRALLRRREMESADNITALYE